MQTKGKVAKCRGNESDVHTCTLHQTIHHMLPFNPYIYKIRKLFFSKTEELLGVFVDNKLKWETQNREMLRNAILSCTFSE